MSITRTTTSAFARPRRGGLSPGASRAITGSAIGSPRSPLPWSPQAVRAEQQAELERYQAAVDGWAEDFDGLVRHLFARLTEWDQAQQRLEAGLRAVGHGRTLAEWAQRVVVDEEGQVYLARQVLLESVVRYHHRGAVQPW